MNLMLLRRQWKIVVPQGTGQASLPALTTFHKNLESLGFSLSAELFERLGTLDDARLGSLYQRLVKSLRTLVGEHRAFCPMYPNFPAQVMALDEAQLYRNALLHYWGVADHYGEPQPRPALQERLPLRVIGLGTHDDVVQIFARLARAASPFSAQDREDVTWFVSQYQNRVAALLPQRIACKENLALIAAACLRAQAMTLEQIGAHVQGATDVLRIAVALSGGDVSLASPTRFGKFERRLRVCLLGWLEQLGSPLEDMQRWSGRWLRLGERLHPGEYAARFVQAAAAFEALRNGRRKAGFYSAVEAALEKQDATAALTVLQARPGELARKLDVLLRTGADPQAPIDAFSRHAAQVSTPVLLQVMAHFKHRHVPRDLRIFFPKGQVANVFALPPTSPPMAAELSQQLVAVCERTLVQRFSTLPSLGTTFLDPRLRDYLVPFAQRSASKALRTVARGSRLALPDCSTLRFFVWWKNGDSRADIDLSAVMYSADYGYIDTLAYYNLKNFGAHHSGDIVDAPQGACEFIDIDLERCRRAGVRYVVMSLSSFTQQPYCHLPECFAGWMARTDPNSGEIFEPATVLSRVDVSANTKFCLPAIFDIERMQTIWADIALTNYPRFNINVRNNLRGVSLMLRAMDQLQKPDLHTLFELHIRARGTPAPQMEGADTVFALNTGVTPFNLDRISSEFM